MYAKFFCAVSCPQGIPKQVLYTFITNAVFGTGLAVHTFLGLNHSNGSHRSLVAN